MAKLSLEAYDEVRAQNLTEEEYMNKVVNSGGEGDLNIGADERATIKPAIPRPEPSWIENFFAENNKPWCPSYYQYANKRIQVDSTAGSFVVDWYAVAGGWISQGYSNNKIRINKKNAS